MSLLKSVTSKPRSLPPRQVLYGVEKFGKTSWAAFSSWRPIFIMSAAETGLITLLETGQVPPTDHFPEDARDWQTVQQCVWELRDGDHSYEEVVFDTGNGLEKLCAQAVCDQNFHGDWTQFNDYGKGNDLTAKWWADFLRQLEELRMRRNMAITLLYHCKVKSFNNPSGKDYDQYKPEGIEKCWSETAKWSDVIMFGSLRVKVVKDKAEGGEERFLRTQPCGSAIAGNRYSLPAEITSAAGAKNLRKAYEEALTKARGAAGVQGLKLGALPTQEEFVEIIKKKGRTLDMFRDWAKKAHPTCNPQMYGRLQPAIIEQYLNNMKTLPDVNPNAGKEPGGTSPPPPAAPVEKAADAKPVEESKPVEKVAETPKEPPSSPPPPPPPPAPVEEPKPATPETDEAKAVREAAEADERKEIVERDELETAVYELAEQIGYKPRGLMELHVPRLGHRLAKGDTLASLPLPILRKFVEALQQMATQKREQNK